MSPAFRKLLAVPGIREIWNRVRDNPTWISLDGYSIAELSNWTFVENTLPVEDAKRQSQALAQVGIYAVSFRKRVDGWTITFAVPPDVSFSTAS